MQLTDTIADMLTRIRNANSAKHISVNVPFSKMKESIASILLEEGYIYGYHNIKIKNRDFIKIKLKYSKNKQPVISGLKRVSKPGLRVYASCDKLPRVMKGLGTAIISTSNGVITDKLARKIKSGGEVLAYVW